MDGRVSQLAADSGALVSIRGRRAGSGFAALAFVFEHGTLLLDCDVDADEVIASTVATPSDEYEILDDAPLAPLRGKIVEQAWTMTNHRGFEDAFQLRCVNLDTRAEACVQVEAAAGVLILVQVPVVG